MRGPPPFMENPNVVHRHIHELGTVAQCLAWAAIIFFFAQCTIKIREADAKTDQARVQMEHNK